MLRLPRWLSGKEYAFDAADEPSIPGSGRSPGEGMAKPTPGFLPENPMDRGAWPPAVHGVAELDMTEQLDM